MNQRYIYSYCLICSRLPLITTLMLFSFFFKSSCIEEENKNRNPHENKLLISKIDTLSGNIKSQSSRSRLFNK